MVVFTGSDSFPEETYEFSNNSDYDQMRLMFICYCTITKCASNELCH